MAGSKALCRTGIGLIVFASLFANGSLDLTGREVAHLIPVRQRYEIALNAALQAKEEWEKAFNEVLKSRGLSPEEYGLDLLNAKIVPLEEDEK